MPPRRWSFAIALALPCLAAPLASAAVRSVADTAWATNGVPVCTADSIEYEPTIVSDGVGGAFVAWLGGLRSAYYYDVCVQHLTSLGTIAPGWPLDGLVLTTTGYSHDHVVMIPDGSGGVFTGWDAGTLYGGLAVQHVSGDGTLGSLWSLGAGQAQRDSGGRDTSATDPLDPLKREHGSNLPVLLSDGAGGVLVTRQYTDWLYGTFIIIHHLTSSGAIAPGWPFGVYVYTVGYPYAHNQVMCSDGAGGAIVASMNWGPGWDIKAQHITSSGSLAPGWSGAGLPICASTGDQGAPGIASDGAGGAFIAWEDARTGLYEQLYIQHVTGDSTIASGWPVDGVMVCSGPTKCGVVRYTSGYDSTCYTSIISDGAGGAIIAWTDYRSGTSFGSGDIYAQRIVSDGSIAPGWPPDGVPVCAAPGEQRYPTIAPDGAGGAFIVWQDARSGLEWHVYAQHVEASGSIASGWVIDGNAICTAPGGQLTPVIGADPAGGFVAAWQDLRGPSPDIYAARVGPDGVVAALASLVSADAEPGRVRLTWYVSGVGTSVSVYRRAPGSAWALLGSTVPDGTGRVTYEDRDVTAGERYGYRLGFRGSGEEEYAGETWVDVPSGLSLALQGARPNPALRDLVVGFRLPSAAPAWLELFDLAGTRVASREVGSLGPGQHLLNLGAGARIPPGLYLIRLHQGQRSHTARAIVVK